MVSITQRQLFRHERTWSRRECPPSLNMRGRQVGRPWNVLPTQLYQRRDTVDLIHEGQLIRNDFLNAEIRVALSPAPVASSQPVSQLVNQPATPSQESYKHAGTNLGMKLPQTKMCMNDWRCLSGASLLLSAPSIARQATPRQAHPAACAQPWPRSSSAVCQAWPGGATVKCLKAETMKYGEPPSQSPSTEVRSPAA